MLVSPPALLGYYPRDAIIKLAGNSACESLVPADEVQRHASARSVDGSDYQTHLSAFSSSSLAMSGSLINGTRTSAMRDNTAIKYALVLFPCAVRDADFRKLISPVVAVHLRSRRTN